ncbi:MAG: hypothetical protein WC785_04780 [Tatlockia sp.]|jgi:hypothetical protein
MVTRKDFGLELKQHVADEWDVAHIGSWAYEMYLGDVDANDVEFLNILLTLSTMEDGPEFALSYQRLEDIAEDLLAGKKDINLDY